MPRQPVKRLNALSLLLGLAVAVPIASCSQLSGIGFASVSKDCDELAPKFLKAMFSQAAENNGEFAKQVAVVQSIQTFKGPPDSDGDQFDRYIYHFNLYQIDASGSIRRFDDQTLLLYENYGLPMTTPSVATSNQIACTYLEIWGNRYKTMPDGSFEQTPPGLGKESYGERIKVSENNEGTYWQRF